MLTSLRTSPKVRSIVRKSGLVRPATRLRSLALRVAGKDDYEHAFSQALAGLVRDGDVVWDVGANLGIYTEQFAHLVGGAGRVVAIEPTTACVKLLTERVQSLPNVTALRIALGSSRHQAEINLADDPLGATHSLGRALSGNTESVEVWPGDSLVADGQAPLPNVVKIDVEGYECEVLAGMREIIANPDCRAVVCEVHFSEMERMGNPSGPTKIVSNLRSSGMSVRWTDASHLVAVRG